MPRILISYRREDSAPYAGRLYDHLAQHFGRENVFMDIAAIKPGQDFSAVIEQFVGACDCLIAVIGRAWLTSAGREPGRRLDSPDDFVRREVATALGRNITVIPTLVGGATMPERRDLPDDLAGLSRYQALEISDTRFQEDVARLIEALNRLPASASGAAVDAHAPPQTVPMKRWLIAVPVVAATLALGYWLQGRDNSAPAAVEATAEPPALATTQAAQPRGTDAAPEGTVPPIATAPVIPRPSPPATTTKPSPESARLELARLSLGYAPMEFVRSAQMGDLIAVRLFLAAGMDPNATSGNSSNDTGDDKGATALMAASARGHTAVVDALMKAGGDVQKTNSASSTPLTSASAGGHLETVKVLLTADNGAGSVDAAFIDAIGRMRRDVAQLLVKRGADVKKAGPTALVFMLERSDVEAKGQGQQEVRDFVRFVLDLGVDANDRDRDGWTPLLAAARKGYTAALRLLVEAGADVNAACECPDTGFGGYTPLMFAADVEDLESVELLLSRRADVHKKNERGQTALARAERHGPQSDGSRGRRIIQLLKSAGAP